MPNSHERAKGRIASVIGRCLMLWRVALIALTLTVPSVAHAEKYGCGQFPLLNDSIPREQRAEMLLKRALACVREGKPVQSIALFSELRCRQATWR